MRSCQTAQTALVALLGLTLMNLASGCLGTAQPADSVDPTASGGSTASTGGATGSTDTAGPSSTTGSGGSTVASSGTVQLAATGQTTSYADGDDGEHQQGESVAASQRFVDNGDGTVTDQQTNLMWLKDASCLIHNYVEWESDGWAEGWVPWADALQFIAQINDGTLSACAAGHNDWRLPTVNELESLVNAGEAQLNEWLMTVGFESVEANDYWTSTTDPDTITTFAYVVDFEDGGVSRLGNKVTAPGITSVWPVRGTTDGSTTEIWKTGQTIRYATGDDGDNQQGIVWPEPRFGDNGDGTITDHLTGLTWLQDGASLGSDGWNGALIIADRFNDDPGHFDCENYAATYTDWRLPNRKELFSLADFSRHDPVLQLSHPFIDISVNASYWSSTTNAADTDRAWHCDLRTGEISTDFKVNGHRVLLVR